jgi:hypothetical protein
MASSQEIQLAASASQLREMWEHKTGERLGPGWDSAFLDWIKRWGFGLVADAVQSVAASGYSEDGEHRPPNVRDVPRYAAVEQAEEAEPGMRDCYWVRGHMRKKFLSRDSDGEVLALLKAAMRAGIPASEMYRAVEENNTLEDCFAALGVDRTEFRRAMGHPIVDLPTRHRVFIREDEREWQLWDSHLRKMTGKGAPMNKYFGWYFPTRVPPVDAPPKSRSRNRLQRTGADAPPTKPDQRGGLEPKA